jgi:hypothetical protein
MDLLFTMLLAHIRKQEWKEAVDLVVANPILITMEDDELQFFPLQHALFNQAPFNVIFTFVSHWLLLKDLQSLTEMELVHLACEHNATSNVMRYLLSLSPWREKLLWKVSPFVLMKGLFTKLLAHICKQEWKEAVDLVVANPILIMMEDDKLQLSPLQHTLFNQAPFNIIFTFVSHWLLLADLHSLTEMELLHLACKHNATFDVIRYLLSLSPESWKTKNSTSYTPFMIALSKKLDKDILRILDNSVIGAIGDFNSLATAKNKVVDVYFEHDYKGIDSQKTLFRLEHKDPTLKCLALADSFHLLYPDKGDSSFDHNKHEKVVINVFDAVRSFPHLRELIIAVDKYKDILWREGNAHNALFLLQGLPSQVVITIRVAIAINGSVNNVAEMLKYCHNLQHLLRSVDTKCDEWDRRPG